MFSKTINLFFIFIYPIIITMINVSGSGLQIETRSVNEFESFEYKFENSSNIDYCYFHTTPFNGYYLLHNDTDNVLNDIPKRFSFYFDECGFNLTFATLEDAMDYSLTAHDMVANKNFTKQLKLFVNTRASPQPYLPFDTINVLENASYYQYLIGEDQINWCILQYEKNRIYLDLNTHKATFLNKTDKEHPDLRTRLTSLGDDLCGFKITTARKNDPTKWTFTATDVNNKNYKVSTKVKVHVLDRDTNKRIQNVYLGQSTTLICGNSFVHKDDLQYYCKLFSPTGKVISNGVSCIHEIDLVTMDDIGIWRCEVGHRYSMEILLFTSELIKNDDEIIETVSFINERYYLIGCKLINFEKTDVSYCKITRPDGKIFKIQNGAASDRYTTYGTNLTQGICSLQIPYPLMRYEKGLWKCEIHGDLGVTNIAGKYFYFDIEPVTQIDTFSHKNVNLGEPFTIQCNVKYISKHCHITSPKGTVYSTENIYLTYIGDCSITINNATNEHNGNWTCTFAREELEDDIITIDVNVLGKDPIIYYSDVEVIDGEDALLLCSTNGIPLEYCRFVLPNGISYYLDDGEVKSRKYLYNGRGLKHGDCGVQILRTNSTQDAGTWHCYMSLKQRKITERSEIFKPVIVKIYSSSGVRFAKSIGPSFGFVIVFLLFTGLFVWRVIRKRRNLKIDSLERIYYSNGANNGNIG